MIVTLVILLILLWIANQVEWTRVRQISALHVAVATTLLWAARTNDKKLRTNVLNTIAILAIVYHGIRFFQ
jgi:hypothetical protein